MRSFASLSRVRAAGLAVALMILVAGVGLAQEGPAAALFEDARSLESALRKEIGTYRSGSPSLPLIRRARILVGTYEDIARLFPEGGYGDKALWQGASLAADVFDVFKDATDRASAVRLTEALGAKYPSSTFRALANRRSSTLALAVPGAPESTQAVVPTPAAPSQPSGVEPAPPILAPAAAPKLPKTSAPPSGPSVLQAIHREVLPDVLRVSIELDHEVVFRDERLSGPSRVFVDLQNTRAATDIQDARLSFDDDVVRQIRVGRQLDRRTRVVLDLSDAPVHSVYTLYNPFRIVIDFERARAVATHPLETPRTVQVPVAKIIEPPAVPMPTPAPPAKAPRVTSPISPAAKVASAPTQATKPAASAPSMIAAPATPPANADKAEAPLALPGLPPVRTASGLSISRQLGLGIARVVIDPGHGGHDPGARQDNTSESELVLDVALRLELLLQKEGVEVILTRRNNVYVPLEERPALAMREAADLYLSIHANASADRRVRGVETYILNFAPNAQSRALAARENMGSSRTMKSLPDIVKTIALNNKIEESRDLARQVQASLVEKLSTGNRTVRNLGVKQAPFAVLVGADMPSILAEIGFITNKQDAALVKTAVYRQQIAEALASGIFRYQKRLKPSQFAAAGQ